MRKNRFCMLFTISFLLSFSGMSAHSQNYIPIDRDSNIYCAELPGGESMVVRYDPKTGTLASVDASSEASRVQKQIGKDRRRAKQLRNIRKKQVPTKNVKTYLTIYKYVYGKKFRGEVSQQRILNTISKTIKRLNKQIKSRESIVEDIDACENGTLEDPSGGFMRVISFEFTHPDLGIPFWMYGIGLVYDVSNIKKAIPPVCIGAENKASTDLPQLPDEGLATPSLNPCLRFYPSLFKNRPNCSAEMIDGSSTSAVIWIQVHHNQEPFRTVSEEDLIELKNSIGFVASRAYKKKNPCD